MKKLTLFLCLLGHLPAFGSGEHLRRSVSLANQSLGLLPQLTRVNSHCRSKNMSHCPKVLLDSLEDLYDEGSVLGLVDRAFNDGKFRSPRYSCESAAKSLKNIDIEKIQNQLNQAYPNHDQAQDFSIQCESEFEKIGIPPEERNIAKAYLVADFNAKNQVLEKQLLNTFAAKFQSLQALEQPISICDKHRGKVKDLCLEQKSCVNRGGSFVRFRTRKLKVAQQGLAKLYKQREQLGPAIQLRGNSKRRRKLERIKDAINQILKLNPILESKSFAKIRKKSEAGKSASLSQIKEDFKKHLKNSQDKLDDKIQTLSRSHDCLLGRGSKCHQFAESVDKNTFNDTSNILFDKENKPLSDLNHAHNFYQCAQNQKRNHEQTDQALSDAAIGVALTLTPMTAINAVKAASNAGKLIKNATQAQRATRGIEGAAYAGDLAYGGYHSQKIFRKCKANQDIVKNLKKSNDQSCQDQKKSRLAANNSSQCATQLLVSAALMAPVKLQSMQIFRPSRRASSISSRQREETLGEVFTNSKLTDSARTQKAAKILDVKNLTEKQEQALLKAHHHGSGSVFNYTKAELKEKTKILRQEFSEGQASALLRKGLAGKPTTSLLRSSAGKYISPNKPYSYSEIPSLKGTGIATEANHVFRGDSHHFQSVEDIEDLLHNGTVRNVGGKDSAQTTIRAISDSNEALKNGNPKKWATLIENQVQSRQAPVISATTDTKIAKQFAESGEGLPVIIQMRSHESMVDLSKFARKFPEESRNIFGRDANLEGEVYLPGGIDPGQIDSVAVMPRGKTSDRPLYVLGKKNGKIICEAKSGSCPEKFGQ